MEERKIFDPKFVHFMWDDSMKGKKGFYADCIDSLINHVEMNSSDFYGQLQGKSSSCPFRILNGAHWRFFYYDPLYEVKWAWKQGKQIQSRSAVAIDSEWKDTDYPEWNNSCEEFRVKPDRFKLILRSDTNKLELVSADVWTEEDETKCIGTREECHDVAVKQYCAHCSHFDSPCIWRECTGFVPKKKWRPFKDIKELKKEWDDKQGLRFVHPELVEPVIWVREKQNSMSRMIRDFDYNRGMVHIGHWCSLEYLFSTVEFLDGTPCGVEE